MTTITLPPEIEGPLIEQADKRGITPEQLVLDSLRALFVPGAAEEHATEGTLYSFLAGYVSTIEGTTEALGRDPGRHFAAGMAEKRQQPKLTV